ASELQLSSIDLADLLGDIVRDWEKKFAEKGVKVDVDLAPNLAPIRANEERLQEILYNLLDNAVKYTPAGGEICLRAEQTPTLTTLSVSDSGVGIPQEDLPRIFERFYRADTARNCTAAGSRRRASSEKARPFA